MARDIAGNSFNTALNLGTLRNKTRSITEVVGRLDSNDYFRFKLKSTSASIISLTGLSADADLEIYYETRNNPAVYSQTGTNNEVAVDPDAPKGFYYVRVFPGTFRRAIDYTLTIHAVELPRSGLTSRVRSRSASTDKFNAMGETSKRRKQPKSLWK
ncbi:MAG: PPC domain-containing protein [Synechococcales cyanobacterium T60_A2020_003]|nr:PPC domain-containing protein [Synechococcales cyanobacterium T60_A2020_003]